MIIIFFLPVIKVNGRPLKTLELPPLNINALTINDMEGAEEIEKNGSPTAAKNCKVSN